MYRIRLPYLYWVIQGLTKGEIKNQVSVDSDVAGDAKIALERMFAL